MMTEVRMELTKLQVTLLKLMASGMELVYFRWHTGPDEFEHWAFYHWPSENYQPILTTLYNDAVGIDGNIMSVDAEDAWGLIDNGYTTRVVDAIVLNPIEQHRISEKGLNLVGGMSK